MIDVTISNKLMKPGIIHTDDFKTAEKIIRFTIPDYMQDNVDLRKFKAYVVTSLNGEPDMAEIPYTISGRQLILVWSLSLYTLRDPGVIQFQIKFASNEQDSPAAWWSYKGVLINRVPIESEDLLSANYPTLMKQWLDLMQKLSGSFGAEVVYMPVGQSIPVKERLEGRMYYQWLQTPSKRAVCASGTINLGERPYADSGLYINDVHICVDYSSSFVLDPSAWVDAINAAECGVIATDISVGSDILLLITAADAGKAGNSITMELTTATYGGGSGKTNPSGGRLSGSTLAGGVDAISGVENPTGQFEDANGNVLGYNRAKHLTDPNLNELLEDGEYVCTGTITNSPVSGNTYCVLRSTNSDTTNRVVQECFCVTSGDNSVRTFVRSLTDSSDAGQWRELVRDDQLATELSKIKRIPDYKSGVDATNGMTMPVDALVVVKGVLSRCWLKVDDVFVASADCGDSQGVAKTAYVNAPVPAGSVITFHNNASAKYYPYK